jgi:hypothetical protein
MKIAEHLAKAARFEALRARLDPVADFELWFWMGLSAGTALINAALHAGGLTDENHRFATQVPDVYAVADGDGWRPEIAFRCDLIHAGLPALEGVLPPPISRAFEAMEVIEHYRDPCVRGDHPVTAELIVRLATAYEHCAGAAREAIGNGGGGPP